jgi:hypothetical protein
MMRVILLVAAVVSLLDAATTYVLITNSSGVEANPLLQFLNDVPEAAFFVQPLGLLMLASSVKIIEISAAALPAALKTRVHGTATAAFTAAVAYRAAVVANNLMGITYGITPLADLYA